MKYLWIVPVLLILYLLTLRGRRRHPAIPLLKKHLYAHRGLHKEGVPENSLAAFRAAKEKGYGVELDVHLMADGNLAVIHDASLKRTAGVEVTIESLTADALPGYRLEGTEESIPTLEQVLALFEGKVPMIVELKPAGGNHKALTDRAVEVLRQYKGLYCIESFDPRCIRHLKKYYPHICRGQLAENFFKAKSKLPWIFKFLLTHHLMNFLLLPDFVAYQFSHRRNLGLFLTRKLWGVQGVAWTLRSPEDHQKAVNAGYIPIFESYEP